jgi:hypothetical protein
MGPVLIPGLAPISVCGKITPNCNVSLLSIQSSGLVKYLLGRRCSQMDVSLETRLKNSGGQGKEDRYQPDSQPVPSGMIPPQQVRAIHLEMPDGVRAAARLSISERARAMTAVNWPITSSMVEAGILDREHLLAAVLVPAITD